MATNHSARQWKVRTTLLVTLLLLDRWQGMIEQKCEGIRMGGKWLKCCPILVYGTPFIPRQIKDSISHNCCYRSTTYSRMH